jgi:YcxB-like protein
MVHRATPTIPQRTGIASGSRPEARGRIEVALRPDVWDIYRAEFAERWRRSHSADASIARALAPWLLLLYVIAESVHQLILPSFLHSTVITLGFWFLVGWLLWWLTHPYLDARNQMQASSLAPPIRYAFSAEGFEVLRMDYSLKIAWGGVRKVRETPFSFLIYPTQQSPYSKTPEGDLVQVLPLMKQFFTLPKHCFAREADAAAFRQLARRHVDGEVRLRE